MKITRYSLLLIIIVMATLFSCKTQQKTALPFDPAAVKKFKPGENSPSGVTALFLEGKKQAILGNPDIALGNYRQVIEKDPYHDAAYFEVANIYAALNNWQDALIYVEEAVSLDPENEWYQQALAEAYQRNSKYEEATKVFEGMVENEPNNLDYRFQLALSNIFSGKYNDALKEYNIIEQQIGITEEISIQKQKIYLHQNKVDKAGEEIENLITAFPEESKYYSMLAELYMANGMTEQAYSIYNEISEMFPDDPYIHISLADYYRQTGEKEKSYEALKRGFENPSLNIDTKVQILLSYYTVSDLYEDAKGQAMELVTILVEAHPENPKSHSIYADFLIQDGKYKEAQAAFYNVIALDSSKFLVWDNLLRVDAELSDFSALASDSKRTIEFFPEQPMGYLFNGAANIQLKKYEEAIEVLDRGVFFVIENDLLLAQFYAYLGDAYNQIENNDASDAAYDKVLLLDPNNSYVLNNYAYYLSLRDEGLGKAEIMAKKATQLDPKNDANLDTYGWVLYKLGKYEEAKELIKKALNNGASSNAVILEHYGDVLYKLGDKEEALIYWEKAQDAGKGSEFLDKKVEEGTLFE